MFLYLSCLWFWTLCVFKIGIFYVDTYYLSVLGLKCLLVAKVLSRYKNEYLSNGYMDPYCAQDSNFCARLRVLSAKLSITCCLDRISSCFFSFVVSLFVCVFWTKTNAAVSENRINLKLQYIKKSSQGLYLITEHLNQWN